MEAPGEVRVDPAMFPRGGPPRVSRCVLHGREAVRGVDMALRSRVRAETPMWLRGNLLSMAYESGRWATSVRVVKVYGWPLCRSCAWQRGALFGLFLLVLVGWTALMVTAGVTRATVGVAPWPEVLPWIALAGPFASLALFALAGLPRFVRARVAEDGEKLIVDGPSPGFVEQVRHAR